MSPKTISIHKVLFLKTHLGIHEAQRQTHRYRQQPDEYDLEYDSASSLVPAELHRISQAQVSVHADRAQVHYASRAEQHVQAYPR